MLPKCKQAVNAAAKAIGRAAPTEAQYAAIEAQIGAKMRELARRDPAGWKTLTGDQQMMLAGKAAMEDIKAAADRRLENAEKQILKSAETNERVQALQAEYKGSRAEALKRDFALTHNVISAERKFMQSGLMDLIEASANKAGASLGRKALMTVFQAENNVMTRDIVREIFKNADGATGNRVATAAARAWLDTIEAARVRFNAAGGDVGRLEYGYVPQPHDTSKVRKAGVDGWVEATLPLLDRKRYLREDGSVMADDELRTTLRAAYETLATEGVNKQTPGQFKGTGARANRGSDSRQIHFSDGDAWATYMQTFGRGSLYDSMMGHVGAMARDTVLVERYGPDVNGQGRLQFDLAAKDDGTVPGRLVGAMSINPETYFNIITGKVGAPANETLARAGDTVRSFNVAAKLGGAVISSITDVGTLVMTTAYNRLPYWQVIRDIGRNLTKEGQDFMSTHGMIAESLASSMNRWSGDHLGNNWAGRMANSVMRASLLNAWTDALRQGFTMSMNAGLARMAKGDWNSLNAFDRARLARNGITEADWQVLQTVQPTQWKGRELLTPQSIIDSGHERAQDIAGKVFGFIHDESEFAVVNPDLATRAVATLGGQQAGTWGGEIARTTMQFKSFPIAMMTRHWARLIEGNLGAEGAPLIANRTAYFTALMLTSVGLGAIATQEKQMLQGKDPIDMTKTRFWFKALAQGGGLSVAGDLFLVDPASSPGDAVGNFAKTMAGPAIGAASELALKVITENIWQAAEGKDTHWEAELAAWAKAQTPGASLWYVRPVIDHALLNGMNESLSPGYLARMKSRAQKDWGQSYWWAPEQGMPSRAPDMARAVGQ